MKDEFYIGYLDRSPPGLARRHRIAVALLATLAALTVGLLAARQTPAEPGEFEFGVVRSFEGVLRESPLPILRHTHASGAVTNYLLVGAGKFGLPDFARGHDGQRVRFEGTLVQRGGARMIELNRPESFEALGPGNAEGAPRIEKVGFVTLMGELVDTKCWHGVMRPATGKVHRACAVRCLSGGIPPGLLVRDSRGNATVALLVGPDGAPLQYDVQWAARTLIARGDLELQDELAVLRVKSLALSDAR